MERQLVEQCLDQVRWKRSRDATFSSRDPILAVQDTLRRMRTDDTLELGKAELLMLLESTQESIKHILQVEHLPETLTEVLALRDVLSKLVAEAAC